LPPAISTVAKTAVGDQTADGIRAAQGSAGTNVTGGKALVDPAQTQLKSLLGA
jgi:hypothetical protein